MGGTFEQWFGERCRERERWTDRRTDIQTSRWRPLLSTFSGFGMLFPSLILRVAVNSALHGAHVVDYFAFLRDYERPLNLLTPFGTDELNQSCATLFA